MRRISITGTFATAVLILCAISASPASALPALACYKVQPAGTGSLPAGCNGTVEVLKQNWVLAQPLTRIEPGLWCAETQKSGKTGMYTSASCATAENNGPFAKVEGVPEQLPNILPAASAGSPITSVASSGKSEFGNGLTKITSTASKGTSSGESENTGSFKTTFEGSTSLLGTCTGAGDTSGDVLVSGTFDIRDAKEGSTLIVVSLFLLNKVVLTCGSTEIGVEGCVAGKITPVSELTELETVTLAKTGSDNNIITVLNEANTAEEACQLLAKVGSAGKTELSAQETTQTLKEFKQNSAAVEILVMGL